jgi:HEAT repeat protein
MKTVVIWLLCAVVLATAPAAALDAPRLRILLKQAPRVVAGRVTHLSEYDDGRVVAARIEVAEVLKGRDADAESSVTVIEMRDLPRRALFASGSQGIGFLRPLHRNSYLDQKLPPGRYSETTDARNGWLSAGSAEDFRAMLEIVRSLVASSRGRATKAGKETMTARQRTFKLLAAHPALLVEDGADSLTEIDGLASSLSDSEKSTLDVALRRDDLPLRVRKRLISAIAANDLRQLIPALQVLSAPELQQTCWKALRDLGAPLDEKQLKERLADSDPQIRITAMREVLDRDQAEGVTRAAQLVRSDPNRKVRMAAIEALGETGDTAAVPPLEEVFLEDDHEMRQSTARALIAIGGEPAADAFYRLAFRGPVDSQRFAVIALLALDVGRDDARVRQIAEKHTDEKIRELLEHGIKHGH